jgi:hypothetical protein
MAAGGDVAAGGDMAAGFRLAIVAGFSYSSCSSCNSGPKYIILRPSLP